MKLYLQYMKMHFKCQLIHRTSFILLSIGQFFVPFSVFAAIYLLFQKFHTIQGWSLYEVGLCYGIVHTSFALSECLARGFDSFSSLVSKGDFDRILVRPQSTFVQVLGSKFEFTKLGRLVQSIVVLLFSLSHLSITFTAFKLLALFLMIFCGVLIFTSLFMVGATLCFWTVEGIEVMNIFTHGGREISQYPLVIYQDWFRKFFTFVIPFGTFNYLPLMYLLDKLEYSSPIYGLIPLLGMLFFLPCLLLWQFGVKHYKSTGS